MSWIHQGYLNFNFALRLAIITVIVRFDVKMHNAYILGHVP